MQLVVQHIGKFGIKVVLFFFLLAAPGFLLGQGGGACYNFSFEQGTLEGWVAGTGCNLIGEDRPADGPCHTPGSGVFNQCCTGNSPAVPENTSVLNWDARHTFCTRGNIDQYTRVAVVPDNLAGFPDVERSLRIGNARNKGQAEMLERLIEVTEENALIAYRYTFVMNDPGVGHDGDEPGSGKMLPYFEVKVTNEATGEVLPCSQKKFLSNDTTLNRTDPMDDPNIPLQQMVVSYTDWETKFIDLTNFVGQTVRLSIINSDCARSGHFGYTYFVAYCKPFIPLRDTTICANESVTLKSPYPSSGWDLMWSTGGTTEEITVNPAVTTIYTLKVKNKLDPDEVACQNETEVTVNVVTGISPVLKDTIVCLGETAALFANPAGTTYDWYTEPTGGTPFHSGESYTTPPLTGKVTYYVQNPAKCATDERAEVNVDVIDVSADATPETTICNGSGQMLNVDGGTDGSIYSWTPTNSLDKPNDKNPIASPIVTTTYTVRVTDKDGRCPAEDTVTIRVEEIVADLDGTDVCIGLTTEFTNLTVPNNVAGNWLWTFGDAATSKEISPTHVYQQPGKYVVGLKVVAGTCESEDTTTVEVFPNPIAAFTPTPRKTTADDPTITFIEGCELAIRGDWDFGDGFGEPYVPGVDPVHVYYATNEGEGPFKYTIRLTVVSEHGCPAEVVDEVEIDNIWTIYVPNSFTPNGDGINDYFKAYGMGIMEFKMTVFNRWGEAVYRGDDINEGWDGTPISGNNIKQDVYVWKVKATNNRGKTIRLMGHVSLLPTSDE